MQNRNKVLIYQILFLGLLTIIVISCKKSINFTERSERDTFIDSRDGKSYKTIKIGDQWIMAENFAYKPETGTYWAYENDTNNVAKFGYLYDWETAKNISPEGWHLPSRKEYISLRKMVGGKFELLPYMEKTYTHLVDGGGSGFNALLAGIRSCDDKYLYLGEQTTFWSSTRTKKGISVYGLTNIIPQSPKRSNVPYAYRNDYHRGCGGFSVRLFKD